MIRRFALVAELRSASVRKFDSMLDFDDAVGRELPKDVELDGSEQDDGSIKLYAFAEDERKSVIAVKEVLTKLCGPENWIGIKTRSLASAD